MVEKGEDAKEREEKELEPGDETPKKATEPEEGSEGSPEEAPIFDFPVAVRLRSKKIRVTICNPISDRNIQKITENPHVFYHYFQ